MRNYAKTFMLRFVEIRLESTRGLIGSKGANVCRQEGVKSKEILKYKTPSVFRNRVLEIVRKIPKGKTLTYKEVADKAGNPKAYRAVGNIMNKNRDPLVPCHRVIRSDGKIGGYAFGKEKKKEILKKEGYI